MIKRTISTFALWAIAVALPLIFGPQGAIWIVATVALATQFELYTLLQRADFRPQKRIGCIFGLLIILGTWYIPQFTQFHRDIGDDIFTVAVVFISLTVIIRPDFSEAKSNIMPTLLGLVLVPYFLNFYVKIIYHYDALGMASTGILMTLWLVAVAKFTDIGGLIIGKILGRHKLARAISPGKTWEGAIGGIIIACFIGGFFCFLFNRCTYMPEGFTVLYAVMISFPIAVIAIASDLIESVIKRKAGVKDSGHIIPGIGGAFDLADSLLLTAPIGYLIFKYTIF